jgi:hypothetical protein
MSWVLRKFEGIFPVRLGFPVSSLQHNIHPQASSPVEERISTWIHSLTHHSLFKIRSESEKVMEPEEEIDLGLSDFWLTGTWLKLKNSSDTHRVVSVRMPPIPSGSMPTIEALFKLLWERSIQSLSTNQKPWLNTKYGIVCTANILPRSLWKPIIQARAKFKKEDLGKV